MYAWVHVCVVSTCVETVGEVPQTSVFLKRAACKSKIGLRLYLAAAETKANHFLMANQNNTCCRLCLCRKKDMLIMDRKTERLQIYGRMDCRSK